MEFQTAADISIIVNNDKFNSVELQPSETLLWQDSDLVGIISIIEKNPQFQTSMGEVRSGFKENLKVSETTRKLDLPAGAFGFASSLRGFTTAFIAVEENKESWITISARDACFEEILSTISIVQRHAQ